MLINNVEIDGEIRSVFIVDGKIVSIGGNAEQDHTEKSINGRGGALLPGLHDHHIHLNGSAGALNSVQCGPPKIENNDQLIAVLHRASGDDWVRGIGYHHSVAGEINREWLDQNGPDRPIRIQHRGGRMWIFNSQAIALLDMEIPEDGRLVDGDVELRKALGTTRPDLDPLIDKLHSLGITGVTEVTPGNDHEDFEHYASHSARLNLTIMGGDALHRYSSSGATRVGPLKIHNHDHDLPSLAELAKKIAKTHDHDRAVAIHCVTRAEMMLSLAAIEEAGIHPGDRIEHAAIADKDIIEQIARMDLTVVTQPHFISEREDAYRRDVEAHERPNLWRLKSFADAGVGLAGGSDAPFGGLNPWHAMAGAVHRPAGFDQDEVISPEAALELYIKPPANAGAAARKIAVGEVADLSLLDRSWKEARRDLASVNVVATWVGGNLVYDTISSTSPHSSAT